MILSDKTYNSYKALRTLRGGSIIVQIGISGIRLVGEWSSLRPLAKCTAHILKGWCCCCSIRYATTRHLPIRRWNPDSNYQSNTSPWQHRPLLARADHLRGHLTPIKCQGSVMYHCPIHRPWQEWQQWQGFHKPLLITLMGDFSASLSFLSSLSFSEGR